MSNVIETIKLKPAIWKNILLLLVSLMFVVSGIFMGMEGETFGYICTAFFGLGVVVFALSLIPDDNYLIISPEGLTIKSLFRKHNLAW